ncbi:MAG TPA: hypothetical protein VGV13_00940 [Methylomirabilota bacterium]|jgi:hypothetical protein|nr:hypothetical protein [Methylomirabilota bacterium]
MSLRAVTKAAERTAQALTLLVGTARGRSAGSMRPLRAFDDRAFADALRRGQMPQTVDALKKAKA